MSDSHLGPSPPISQLLQNSAALLAIAAFFFTCLGFGFGVLIWYYSDREIQREAVRKFVAEEISEAKIGNELRLRSSNCETTKQLTAMSGEIIMMMATSVGATVRLPESVLKIDPAALSTYLIKLEQIEKEMKDRALEAFREIKKGVRCSSESGSL